VGSIPTPSCTDTGRRVPLHRAHRISTASEATACCAALRRAGVRKFLLVTTAFHTRRARVMYRKFCRNSSL